MKKILLISTLLSVVISRSFAQTAKELAVKKTTDSLKMAAMSEYAKKYPLLRQGFFATDIIGKGHVKGELKGKELYEGEMKSTRIRSNFNVPLSQWGKNTVSGTISYMQQHFETDEIKSYSPAFPNTNRSITRSTVGFTATYRRSDSIFNHPVNYFGSISGITDKVSAINRVNYSGSVTIPLKRNQYTTLTVGLVALIDPSAVTPVVPIISYWHKYKDSDLELFIDLPSRIALRKQLSKRSWTSLGTELGNTLYFFDPDQPSLPQNAIYTSLELRTGATFEYLLTRKLILGVNGGVLTTATSRMFGKSDKPSDYFFKTKNASVPYISFSVSFLPFLRSLK